MVWKVLSSSVPQYISDLFPASISAKFLRSLGRDLLVLDLGLVALERLRPLWCCSLKPATS